MRLGLVGLALATSASLLGCAASDEGTEGYVTKAGNGKFDSSIEAVIVDFEFDGQLITNSSFGATSQIQDQMLYTMGQLNGDRSVARLDRLVLSNVTTQSLGGGAVQIDYHARVPVAWGRKNNVPASYTLILPKDVSFSAQQAFTEKYKDDCVDFSAHEVEAGNMWYYYRPNVGGCNLDSNDVLSFTAQVSVSSINTTGKYPEYHKVWEDGQLNVVAVFGKYEDGATANSDAGIAAYNQFVKAAKAEFQNSNLVVTPANVPFTPGSANPEVNLQATLADGRLVNITALLIDGIQTAPASFNVRYAALTPDADLLAYNGHSGLGANIRALTRKGNWVTGQYLLAFINGCDTYAYVDSSLAQAHANVNSDDPQGTKHLDIMTNAMPSFFHSNASNDMKIIRSLINIANPLTFEKIFAGIDSSQVIVVSGEQDNEFVPGFDPNGNGGGGEQNWQGMNESGSVVRNEEVRFSTVKLAQGTYTFEITGTNDADLYVRVGQAPTAQLFDCRPYISGTEEICEVSLTTAAEVHVMVRGWANGASSFTLVGSKN